MLFLSSLIPILLLAWLLFSEDIGLSEISPTVFLTAVSMYVVSHVFRALRLFLLLYDGRIKLEHICCFHFHASATSAVLPFKLGEIWRILVIGRYVTTSGIDRSSDLSPVREWARVIMVIWIERLFDLTAIFVALAMLVLFQQQTAGLIWLIVIAVILFMSLSLLLAMPYHIHLLQRYVITRYNGGGILAVLRFLEEIGEIVSDAGRRIKVRGGAVLVMTGLIWILEAFVVYLVLGLASADTDILTSLVFGLGTGLELSEMLRVVLILALSAGSAAMLLATIVSVVMRKRREVALR